VAPPREKRAGEATEDGPAARLPDAEAAEPRIKDEGRLGRLESPLRMSLGGNEELGREGFHW